MERERKIGWLLVPLGALVLGAFLATRGDAFDALGPPEPEPWPNASEREWQLPDSEAVAKRRVEAAMARDGGWTFVSRSVEPRTPPWTNVTYWYRNVELDSDVQLQVVPGRRPGSQVFLMVDKPTDLAHLGRRFALWRRAHGL